VLHLAFRSHARSFLLLHLQRPICFIAASRLGELSLPPPLYQPVRFV